MNAKPNALKISIGKAEIELVTENGLFRSLGAVTVNGAALRNPRAPFCPWFDSYEGEVFNRFEYVGVETTDDETRVKLRAVSDIAFPFRERRDSSGDLCFRNRSFDTPPATVDLALCFKPAAAKTGGRALAGFTYWFEIAGDTPIHRLLDRATWEVGGNLDDVNLVCRNWLTPRA